MLNSNPVSKLAEGDIEVKIIKQSNHTKWYDVALGIGYLVTSFKIV